MQVLLLCVVRSLGSSCVDLVTIYSAHKKGAMRVEAKGPINYVAGLTSKLHAWPNPTPVAIGSC